MTTLYRRPTRRVALSVEPRLASWDVAGSPGQVRLGDFLDHAEAVAAPMIAAVDGLLAVELTVGLRGELALTDGGRDLDNYLFPLAQRLGPARIAAMFGRKVHGPSFLAVGQAQPGHPAVPPQFSAQIAGSYIRPEWKATLRKRLLQVQHAVLAARAIGMTIGITTGPGRNWANIWAVLPSHRTAVPVLPISISSRSPWPGEPLSSTSDGAPRFHLSPELNVTAPPDLPTTRCV